MSNNTSEKHTFQAEVGQLLDIVTHSLYTDKEIFIRELVSNAADSLEKFRHISLTEKEIFDDKLELEINITTDDKANTITFQDFGVGMDRDELIENIGTIAHSGSKAFAKALQEAKQNAESAGNLIGQFGVGFYSAFMVSDDVTVYTHSWKKDAEHLAWNSDGKTGYTLETVEGQRRGAKIVIKLKEEEKEFAKSERVKAILKKYSSFVPFPINLNGEKVNTMQAIWLRNKSEISDEEYLEFYKYQANAFDEPQLRLHFNADVPLSINALLYTPSENMEKFGFGRTEPGVSLYCKKVLIDPKPKGLLPEWLRFVRGVVDSADIPLNISRESMQDSTLVQKLNKVITNRYLKSLADTAKKNPEKYEAFYKNFHLFLKEGITTDFNYREKLAKLLRFESSLTEKGKTTSLEDYVSRMKEDQKEIYYLLADDRDSIENGPYLEAFKARNIEVLFLYEPIDEFVMSHQNEFDGKKLVSADRADIELEDTPDNKKEDALEEKEAKKLCKWIGETLGKRVKEVNTGKRLINSPVIALNADKMSNLTMRRMMKAINPDASDTTDMGPVNLEINPNHPLIKNLSELRDLDPEKAKLITEQLFDNALIAAGFMDNPRTMVDRMNQILEAFSAKA